MTFEVWFDEVLRASAVALGGAGPVLAALWLGRTAIEKYIAARFAKAAANQREAFEQALDVSRRAAARDLEAFKADLTFGAEVRRQVAAKRVAALLDLAAAVEPIAASLLPDPSDQCADLYEALGATLSRTEHLFASDLAQRFRGLYLEFLKLGANPTDFLEAQRVTADMLRMLRHELGIELRKETS